MGRAAPAGVGMCLRFGSRFDYLLPCPREPWSPPRTFICVETAAPLPLTMPGGAVLPLAVMPATVCPSRRPCPPSSRTAPDAAAGWLPRLSALITWPRFMPCERAMLPQPMPWLRSVSTPGKVTARARPTGKMLPHQPARADAGHEESTRAGEIFIEHRAIDRVLGWRYSRG